MAGKRFRPVRVAIFGRRLAELRGKRSARQILQRAGGLGVRLTPSTLYQYENGTVTAPDPAVLWALSRIYGISLDGLVSLLVANRNNLALDEFPDSSEGAIHVDEDDGKLLRKFNQLSRNGQQEVMEFIAFKRQKEVQQRGTKKVQQKRQRIRD